MVVVVVVVVYEYILKLLFTIYVTILFILSI